MELIVAAPFCCLGVFALLGFGLVFLMALRQSQPYSAQEKARAEAAAETCLSQAVPTLLPWTPSALADLSCQWRGTRGGFLIGQYRGVVKSLSNPDGPGLLAYYLSLKGRRGFLRLCTSGPFDPAQNRREVRLDFAAGEATVTSGGQPLGSIRLHDGAIFGLPLDLQSNESERQPIGHYHRYRGLRWQVGSQPLSPRYGSVELYGRTVAEINDGLVRGGGLLAGASRRPLVRNPVPDLTQEEETWLLALVALELYYDAIRRRSRSHSFS